MPKRKRDDRVKEVGEEVLNARDQATTARLLADTAADDLFFEDAGA